MQKSALTRPCGLFLINPQMPQMPQMPQIFKHQLTILSICENLCNLWMICISGLPPSFPLMSSFGLPLAGYPASARWHVFRSPVSSLRLPASGFQFPVSGFQSPVSSFQFPVSSFQFPVSFPSVHTPPKRPRRKILYQGCIIIDYSEY